MATQSSKYIHELYTLQAKSYVHVLLEVELHYVVHVYMAYIIDVGLAMHFSMFFTYM